jgi:hypothetical protein
MLRGEHFPGTKYLSNPKVVVTGSKRNFGDVVKTLIAWDERASSIQPPLQPGEGDETAKKFDCGGDPNRMRDAYLTPRQAQIARTALNEVADDLMRQGARASIGTEESYASMWKQPEMRQANQLREMAVAIPLTETVVLDRAA